MKQAVTIAFVLSISGLSPAFAQIGTMPTTPTLGATSPLGIGPTTSVGGTGIPLGATEIASPGVSPAPTTGTMTAAGTMSGTACSTLGTSPSGMFGSTATYDGGGMAVGSSDTRDRGHVGLRRRMSSTVIDIGNVDNLGNAGNVGIVGNVRLRLEQHGFIVDANVADSTGWQPLEPEFRWDLPRSAISGSVPPQRYRRSSVLPTTSAVGTSDDYRRCPRFPLRRHPYDVREQRNVKSLQAASCNIPQL